MATETFLKLLHLEHNARQLKFFPTPKKKYVDVELIDLKKIIKTVIAYYNYNYYQVIGRKSDKRKVHSHNLVEVRYMIGFIANAWFGIKVVKISKKLNYKDHSAVTYGRDKIARLIEEEDFDTLAHLRNIKLELFKMGLSCG